MGSQGPMWKASGLHSPVKRIFGWAVPLLSQIRLFVISSCWMLVLNVSWVKRGKIPWGTECLKTGGTQIWKSECTAVSQAWPWVNHLTCRGCKTTAVVFRASLTRPTGRPRFASWSQARMKYIRKISVSRAHRIWHSAPLSYLCRTTIFLILF